jgi:hypothetical protein
MRPPRIELRTAERHFALRESGWYLVDGTHEASVSFSHVLEWLSGEERERALGALDALCCDELFAIGQELAGARRGVPEVLAEIEERVCALEALLDELCAAKGWRIQQRAAVGERAQVSVVDVEHLSLERLLAIARVRAFELEVPAEADPACLVELRRTLAAARGRASAEGAPS